MNYKEIFKEEIRVIEKGLEEVLPDASQQPSVLHEGMRYAALGSGKRFRPVLTLITAEALGGKKEEALYPALSLELVHTYSLVHDDLPALDNDELRRGKPTVHKAFGEDLAILVGDGLLTLAFQILSRLNDPQKVLPLLAEISTASGSCGMIGGQVADIKTVDQDLDLPMLDYISTHKTGKLIKASAVCGAIAAGASKEDQQRILKYGELLGMAFQTVDDLHDQDGYMEIMKPKDIRDRVRHLIAQAKREIKPFQKKGKKLNLMADFLLERTLESHHV